MLPFLPRAFPLQPLLLLRPAQRHRQLGLACHCQELEDRIGHSKRAPTMDGTTLFLAVPGQPAGTGMRAAVLSRRHVSAQCVVALTLLTLARYVGCRVLLHVSNVGACQGFNGVGNEGEINERQRRVKGEIIEMDGTRLEERDANGGTAVLLRRCCDNLAQGPSASAKCGQERDSMVELYTSISITTWR